MPVDLEGAAVLARLPGGSGSCGLRPWFPGSGGRSVRGFSCPGSGGFPCSRLTSAVVMPAALAPSSWSKSALISHLLECSAAEQAVSAHGLDRDRLPVRGGSLVRPRGSWCPCWARSRSPGAAVSGGASCPRSAFYRHQARQNEHVFRSVCMHLGYDARADAVLPSFAGPGAIAPPSQTVRANRAHPQRTIGTAS